jgi:hypothetical protein
MFQPNWLSSGVQFVLLMQQLFHFPVVIVAGPFLCRLHAADMHMFSLWFCWLLILFGSACAM